jgi:hypothetical protein
MTYGQEQRYRDSLTVRLSVRASFSITVGLYDGPVTRAAIAEHVAALTGDGWNVADFIDGWAIEEICDDDGARQLIETTSNGAAQ